LVALAALVTFVASPTSGCDFAVSGLSLLLTVFAVALVCVDGADAASPDVELASAHADISKAAVTSAAPAPPRVRHVSLSAGRAIWSGSIALSDRNEACPCTPSTDPSPNAPVLFMMSPP
jgi:hypothetical protein